MKKEIRTRTITEEYEVYITEDGKEFNNYPSASAHEEELNREKAEMVLNGKATLIEGYEFLDYLVGNLDNDTPQYLVVLNGEDSMGDIEELFNKGLERYWNHKIGFDYYNCSNDRTEGTFVVVFNTDVSWGTWVDIDTLVADVCDKAKFVVGSVDEIKEEIGK